MALIGVRGYGYSGPLVVVLHGGPGAPGAVRGLAEALSDEFRVLEPLTETREAEERDVLVEARRRLSERAQSFDPIEVPVPDFPATRSAQRRRGPTCCGCRRRPSSRRGSRRSTYRC